jgi:hypothetical protein
MLKCQKVHFGSAGEPKLARLLLTFSGTASIMSSLPAMEATTTLITFPVLSGKLLGEGRSTSFR